jgi:hypothetical protein
MLLLGAMALIAGVVAGATEAGAEAGAGAGAGEDDRGLDGLTDSDDEDDGMDLGEDDLGVTVTRKQLLYALRQCEQVYKDDDPGDQYTIIENKGAKAMVQTFPDGRVEITFRSTYVGVMDRLFDELSPSSDLPTEGDSLRNMMTSTLLESMVKGLGLWGYYTKKVVAEIDKGTWQSMFADANAHIVNLVVGLKTRPGNVDDDHGIVGLGFAMYLNLLYDKINDVIVDLVGSIDDADITVHGHSLGAVMAQLYALRMLLNRDKAVTRVYAFGSPKGFELFGTRFCEEIDIINVLHKDDPVTYGYPVMYTTPGYKIVFTDDSYTLLTPDRQPKHLPQKADETFEYMRKKQATPRLATAEEIAKYADQDAMMVKNDWYDEWYRRFESAKSTVLQFRYNLPQKALAQMRQTYGNVGLTKHWVPSYIDLVMKLIGDDGVTFSRVSYTKPWGGRMPTANLNIQGTAIRNLAQYYERIIVPRPIGSTPHAPHTRNTLSSSPASMTLADYVTSDMLMHGFVFYEPNQKTQLENNFVQF